MDEVLDDRWVTAVHTNTSPSWAQPQIHRETLRFTTKEELDILLAKSGMTLVEPYGDWDRRPFGRDSREIISAVRRSR